MPRAYFRGNYFSRKSQSVAIHLMHGCHGGSTRCILPHGDGNLGLPSQVCHVTSISSFLLHFTVFFAIFLHTEIRIMIIVTTMTMKIGNSVGGFILGHSSDDNCVFFPLFPT